MNTSTVRCVGISVWLRGVRRVLQEPAGTNLSGVYVQKMRWVLCSVLP